MFDWVIVGESELCLRVKFVESLNVFVGYLEYFFVDKVVKILEIYWFYLMEWSDVRIKWFWEVVYLLL